jgi:hypothetical protein
LPPSAIIAYSAFTDPSGGKADSFTVAIGHKENRRAVIDLVRAWAPPFDPGVVTGEIAEVLKGYGVLNVTGDNYAGKWPVASFRTHGIAYERCEKSKSEMYLAFVPVTNSGDVELPDNKRLLTELRRLERKRGRAGKDTVDHPPRLHDDLANSVAGVSYLLINEDEFERIFPSVRESSRACARKQQTIMYIQYQKADLLAGDDEKWIATDTDEKRHNYKRMVCAVVLPEERERRRCAVIIAENTSRQRPQRSSRCLQPSPATGRTSYRRSGASAANGNFQF